MAIYMGFGCRIEGPYRDAVAADLAALMYMDLAWQVLRICDPPEPWAAGNCFAVHTRQTLDSLYGEPA